MGIKSVPSPRKISRLEQPNYGISDLMPCADLSTFELSAQQTSNLHCVKMATHKAEYPIHAMLIQRMCTCIFSRGEGEGTRRNAADACAAQSGGPTPRPRCRPLDPRARWLLGPTEARVQDPTDALICAHVSSPERSRRISNET